MKTIREVLPLAAEYLKKNQISRFRRDAEELLGFHLKLKAMDLYLQFDRPLEEKELHLFRESLSRRALGEPLDYIFGEKEFFGVKLLVTPDVLIPRQETEVLLSRVYEDLSHISLKGKVAWDICTGSGCLGLGLKKAFPELKVILSDFSAAALQIAEKNRAFNELDVEIFHGDLLHPFQGMKADIILCNPPYISNQEYAVLDREVVEFEPKMALLAGPTGLEFYQKLSTALPEYLNPGAKIYFEIGSGQGGQVKKFFLHPCWGQPIVDLDWSGHERFFSVCYFP